MRAGVSHRSFAGCAIVLDVDHDRYWRVGPATASTLDGLCGRAATEPDPAEIARLCRLQLVEPDDGNRVATNFELPQPDASALEDGTPSPDPGPADAIEIGWRCLSARRLVHRMPFATIIDRLRNRRLAADVTASHDQVALARRFKRARRAIPLANRCLPDTLAFLAFTARRGHFPHLVFGVEAWPFAAHCWAQSETVVLNDALDHARRFAPILVI